MHVGTHMDAPLHMVEGGAVISDLPLDKFEGRGVLIDARGRAAIDADLLEGRDIRKGDIVLVWTGWDRKFRTDAYYEDWPYFTPAFAQALADRQIALVGVDTPGPDVDESFPAHNILLPRDVLIVEIMTALEKLEGCENFRVGAYPAKYHAAAAPVRIFAIL